MWAFPTVHCEARRQGSDEMVRVYVYSVLSDLLFYLSYWLFFCCWVNSSLCALRCKHKASNRLSLLQKLPPFSPSLVTQARTHVYTHSSPFVAFSVILLVSSAADMPIVVLVCVCVCVCVCVRVCVRACERESDCWQCQVNWIIEGRECTYAICQSLVQSTSKCLIMSCDQFHIVGVSFGAHVSC